MKGREKKRDNTKYLDITRGFVWIPFISVEQKLAIQQNVLLYKKGETCFFLYPSLLLLLLLLHPLLLHYFRPLAAANSLPQ